MASNVSSLAHAAEQGMLVRAECGCGNIRYFRARDLLEVAGGELDPQRLRFRCTSCKPPAVKISLLEVDRDRRPNVTVWRLEKLEGRRIWIPERYR